LWAGVRGRGLRAAGRKIIQAIRSARPLPTNEQRSALRRGRLHAPAGARPRPLTPAHKGRGDKHPGVTESAWQPTPA
jgi:hypothetical protein